MCEVSNNSSPEEENCCCCCNADDNENNSNNSVSGNVSRRYRLVAVGMDDTLLRDDQSISPCTLTTLRALVLHNSHKVNLAICTGRPYKDVHVRLQKLQIPACYTVTSNGACVHDPEGNLLYMRNIDDKIAEQLACLESNTDNIATSVWQQETWWMNKDAEDLQSFYEPLGAWRYNLFDPQTHNDYSGVHKIYWTSRATPSPLPSLIKKLEKEFGEYVDVLFPLPYSVEVMAKGVNKAEGIQHVLHDIEKHDTDNNADNTLNEAVVHTRDKVCNSAMNINKDSGTTDSQVVNDNNTSDVNAVNTAVLCTKTAKENDKKESVRLRGCIAFGDAANDVEMISQAECGCLMGNSYSNATEALFKHDTNGNEVPIANNVCRVGNNDDDGVAMKLIDVFNIHMTENWRQAK